jgi:hypothetical protein
MPNGKKEYQEYFGQLSAEELKSLLKDAGFEIIEDTPGCIFLDEFSLELVTPSAEPVIFYGYELLPNHRRLDSLKVAC